MESWADLSFLLQLPPTKKTPLPSNCFCHGREKATSDPELSIVLIFQFSHSIKEPIICPVLITKFWFMYLAENFVSFDCSFACGSPSLLFLETHWSFHFRQQWNSSLWKAWSSFYVKHVQTFELCLIIKYGINFHCRLLCIISVQFFHTCFTQETQNLFGVTKILLIYSLCFSLLLPISIM